MKRPKLMREWNGATVTTAVVVSNSLGQIPVGTKGTVRKAGRGLDFESAPCGCCGLKFRVTHCRPEHFNYVGHEGADGHQ